MIKNLREVVFYFTIGWIVPFPIFYIMNDEIPKFNLIVFGILCVISLFLYLQNKFE